jgi:hypothetical protein
MKQQGKTWKDAKGREVPTYAINPVLKEEEKQSQKLARIGLKVEKALIELVEASSEAHLKVYAAKVQVAELKGNKKPSDGMTMNSFDHTIEVKITKPETMYFDNDYTQMVKSKFDEYFDSLNAGNETAVFLRDLVKDLLFTSGGRLDNSKVLKLRSYRDQLASSKNLKGKSKAFIEAVDLFDKAIKTKPGNTGIYISVADSPGGKKRRVALKFQDVEL